MTTPAPKRERRRHPRAITSFSGVLTVGARTYPSRIINLSMGGALLNLGHAKPEPPIQIGDRLSLEIRCRGGAGPVTVDGKVVLWNKTSGPTALLAVQFDEVSGDEAEVLEELMLEALSNLRERQLVGSR